MSIIVPLVASFDLQCSTAAITSWTSYTGSLYQCWTSSVIIDSPDEIISSVDGATTPTIFQGLRFLGRTVHFLPKGIGKFFPDLQRLMVSGVGLKMIQAADLQGLNNLESLIINGNNLEELSSDLLQNTPKVNDLDFGYNNISRIGKDLLKNFHCFTKIDLSGNKCINKEVTSGFEAFKVELQVKCPGSIDITDANISKLEAETHEHKISKLEAKISQLEAEIERLKLTCCNAVT